jgi:hypothetical protein
MIWFFISNQCCAERFASALALSVRAEGLSKV